MPATSDVAEGRAFVIAGGLVFDGSGRPARRADVLIAEGRVVAAGAEVPADGATRVDAGGCWVTPGFIDAHSHADLVALSGEAMDVRALGGVTTEIVAQDGLGYAPLPRAAREPIAAVLAPLAGASPATAPAWPSIAAYLSECDAGAYARVATLVPQGSVRAAVLGADDREAGAEELELMAALVAEGMDEGAVGISTGLTYPPGRWAGLEELVAVTAPVGRNGGRYVTHLRDYGDDFGAAIDEAIEIGRRAETPVHFSHFHVSGAGRDGCAAEYLASMRAARDSLDVTLDAYPYDVACTFLASTLPPWLQAEEPSLLATRLRDPAVADRAAADMERMGPGATFAVGWQGLLLAGLHGGPDGDLDLLPIPAAAERRGRPVGGLVVDLLRRYDLMICVLAEQGHMRNVRRIAQEPGHIVGSDGIMGSGVPHPRAGGAFLRYLRWARDGVIDVEVAEMVAMMTGRTGELFRLPVGRIQPGAPADVLVIDPHRLEDGPDKGPYSAGAVQRSYIAGVPVVEDGRWAGRRLPGMALRTGAGAR